MERPSSPPLRPNPAGEQDHSRPLRQRPRRDNELVVSTSLHGWGRGVGMAAVGDSLGVFAVWIGGRLRKRKLAAEPDPDTP
jgi:hypothetical protein